MKFILIIIAVFFYSCSDNKKPKDEATTGTATTPKKHLGGRTRHCEYSDLSNQFNITIDFTHYSSTKAFSDSCIINLRINDKSRQLLDTISFFSTAYMTQTLAECDSVRSYTTKLNSDKEVVDGYYGDLVVADLNFDDKDDIALINDSGGNGDPLYNYYMQTAGKKFVFDNYLTDSIKYFPDKIDNSKQQLITLTRAGNCCAARITYQYDVSKNQWRQIDHKILGR